MTMDSGMFQCLASNPAGNIQSSAFLNVFHAGNFKSFPFVYLSAMLYLKEVEIFWFYKLKLYNFNMSVKY